MHRELNPHLFGGKAASDKQTSSTPGPYDPALPSQVSAGMPRLPGPIPPEFKQLEAHVHQLKVQLQSTEKRNELLMTQMQELARNTTSRFERVSQALTRLEGAAAQQIQELTAKYSAIAAKVNERKVQDAKVQEMIDRHNNIVRAFENRLTHMQRVMSEQEMQILNSQAVLDDARQELARIRRPQHP